MATQKIAITVPPDFLKKVDQWAKKLGKSRSGFIVDQIDNRVKTLEDNEVTRLYDEAYSDSDTISQYRELVEDMLNMHPIHKAK